MGRGHECLVPRLCHDTRYGLSVRRNRNYEFEDDMSKTHKKHKHRHHHRHSSKTSDHHRKSSDNKNSQRRKEKELPSRTAFPLKRAESAPALLEAMVSSASAASKLETATNSLVGVEGDLTSVVPLPTGYDVSSRAASTSVAVEAKTITCRAEMETDVTCRLRGGTRTVDEGVFVISSVDEEPAILLLIETDDHHTSEEPATVVVPKTETEKDQGTQLTQDQGSHLTHDQGTQLMKLTPLASIMGEKGTCDITGVVPSILEHLSPSHLEESEAVGKKPPRSAEVGHRSQSLRPFKADLLDKLDSSFLKQNRHHQRSHSRPHKSKDLGSKSPQLRSRTSKSHSRSRQSRVRLSRSRSRSPRSNSRSSRSRSQRLHSRRHRSHSRRHGSHSRCHRSHSRRHRSKPRRRTRRSRSRSRRSSSHSRSGSHSRSRSGSHSRSKRSSSHFRSGRSGFRSRAEDKAHHSEHEPVQCARGVHVARSITVFETTPPSSILPSTSITTAATPTSSQSADSKQSTISVLVSMCKELAVKQAVESMNDINQPKESTGRIRAPFVVASIPSTAIVSRSGAWKASNQIAAPPKPKPLETLYPVSAGLQHHDNQTVDGGSCSGCVPVQSIALGELVAKRLEATARLQACLNDVVAMETLAEVEEKASRWCQSLVKPGQFTGAQLVRPMSMKEHQMGHQAWVTKSMFRDLAPVSGVGMKMLKKMGWEEGCPLGRSGQGHVEPIEVEIKMDRYGLGSGGKSHPAPAVGRQVKPRRKAANWLRRVSSVKSISWAAANYASL